MRMRSLRLSLKRVTATMSSENNNSEVSERPLKRRCVQFAETVKGMDYEKYITSNDGGVASNEEDISDWVQAPLVPFECPTLKKDGQNPSVKITNICLEKVDRSKKIDKAFIVEQIQMYAADEPCKASVVLDVETRVRSVVAKMEGNVRVSMLPSTIIVSPARLPLIKETLALVECIRADGVCV